MRQEYNIIMCYLKEAAGSVMRIFVDGVSLQRGISSLKIR
jgi:hypothetical protein